MDINLLPGRHQPMPPRSLNEMLFREGKEHLAHNRLEDQEVVQSDDSAGVLVQAVIAQAARGRYYHKTNLHQ